MSPTELSRRNVLALGVAAFDAAKKKEAGDLQPIIVSVNLMLNLGAHSGKGLNQAEVERFKYLQDRAAQQFAISGIHFDLQLMQGAYLREQGYSEIPDKFLVTKRINLFVTDSLMLDVDRNRTGGSSIGPHPRWRLYPANRFFKIFLGLREASDTTLAHEYAHHFALDTQSNPVGAGNLWADLRNDYWLWLQRHGTPIKGFRACAKSDWARIETKSQS